MPMMVRLYANIVRTEKQKLKPEKITMLPI